MSHFNRDREECEFNQCWCVECFSELPKEERDKEIHRIRMKRIKARNAREGVSEYE